MRCVKTAFRYYLIVSALLPVVLLWNPPPAPKTPLCTLPECKTRGALYHQNMGVFGNPCKDFYQFACGSWNRQNPRPAYQLDWTTITTMHRVTLGQLKTLLEKPVTHRDSRELQRVRRVFNVCMNLPSLGRGNVDFLVKTVDVVGHYPQTSISDLHNRYVKLTGESPLFSIQITANTNQNDEPLLLFKDIKSPFGSLVQLKPWTPDNIKMYRKFLLNLLKLVWKGKQPALEERAINTIVNDVINFRVHLNQISRTSMKTKADTLEPLTVKALQQWYDIYKKHTKSSRINWETIVRNLYTGVSDAALLKNPTVGVRRKGYFVNLGKFLAETPEQTLAYHFEIYFIERHITLSPTMLQSLDELLSKENGNTGYVRNEEMDKSLQCIEDIDMDEAKGKLYVENYFDKKNIPVVEDIFETVREAVKNDIMDSKWVDFATKIAIMGKISDITRWIGYPPWYDNRLLKATSSLMKPAKINAHLAIRANRVCVSAAFLKSPVFDSRLPEVFNYGAIGTTIGHEIYHALNDCGKSKNEKGEEKTWWSKSMREKCEIRKKCFIEQYSELSMEELKSFQLASVRLAPKLMGELSDASKTFLEDLPDVMGLQASFHAYKAKLKKHKNACSVLPHFEQYNCEQMFFISFANSLCGDSTLGAAYAITNVHSSARVRVNGAVSNSEDFSQAFGCSKNHTMYPATRCNLWV